MYPPTTVHFAVQRCKRGSRGSHVCQNLALLATGKTLKQTKNAGERAPKLVCKNDLMNSDKNVITSRGLI